MPGSTLIRDAVLFAATIPFLYYLVALCAAARFSRRRYSILPQKFCPPISILKPVRGLDRESYENYASFCRQEYPTFEVLFCVGDAADPAVPVIEKIIADFPERTIRLLIGSQALGISDKVNKLCRMVREAQHETVLISDSDVRVPPKFLQVIGKSFCDPQVGGVTCLYRGLSDGSIASDFEALGNSTDFAPGVLVARLLGDLDFMLGAVMATTKKQLVEIGGFESIANHLSDDYELGNRIANSGYRVELSDSPVCIVYPEQDFPTALRHQLRWNMTIRCSRPWGHLGLIFSQGLPWTVTASIVAQDWWTGSAYLAAYVTLRLGVAWIVGVSVLGDAFVKRKMWMIPLRDAVAFLVWLWSFFPQRIHWRGQDFYIRDKRLVPIPSRQP
jgi:ceramide glucosyltransferase